MFHRIVTGVMLLLLLAGCQTLSERRQANELQEVLRNYEGVIRWGRVQQARRFQREDTQSGDAKQPTASFRVTQYEVVQGPSVVEETKALQTVVIQYVFQESQVVRETVDQQTWEYDPENERWYLISPLPKFK